MGHPLSAQGFAIAPLDFCRPQHPRTFSMSRRGEREQIEREQSTHGQHLRPGVYQRRRAWRGQPVLTALSCLDAQTIERATSDKLLSEGWSSSMAGDSRPLIDELSPRNRQALYSLFRYFEWADDMRRLYLHLLSESPIGQKRAAGVTAEEAFELAKADPAFKQSVASVLYAFPYMSY